MMGIMLMETDAKATVLVLKLVFDALIKLQVMLEENLMFAGK